MTRMRNVVAASIAVLALGAGSVSAQLVISDPATTARNEATARLKEQIVNTLTAQYERLYRMARRLSAETNLDKFASPGAPRWRTHDFESFQYANAYHAALTYGDPGGGAYAQVARSRRSAGEVLARLSPAAREIVSRGLATLDLADSVAIAATQQTGVLRYNGRRELQAIDKLEADVTDPAATQSATAVLGKISGAVLVGVRQKQARMQFLTAIVEQLLVDNKRARDTEAAVLNMQLGRLRGYDDEGGGFLTGSANDFRTWRQP